MMRLSPLALLLVLFGCAYPKVAPLTPDGLGPVRVGMTLAQVETALSVRLEGVSPYGDDSCVEMHPAGAFQGISYMFEDGRLTRISVHKPKLIATDRGIAVGDSADDVRRIYRSRLEEEPHLYLELPAEYLTYWAVPDERGIRFETNLDRRVEVIHAGGQSIEYVEGCL